MRKLCFDDGTNDLPVFPALESVLQNPALELQCAMFHCDYEFNLSQSRRRPAARAAASRCAQLRRAALRNFTVFTWLRLANVGDEISGCAAVRAHRRSDLL